MKCAIYIRVSKDEMNLDNQRIVLEEYAKRQGWDFTTFEEKESTRKTRPVKQELMTRLRHKEFDVVLIRQLARFARSLQELLMDVTELTDKGVIFCSYKENIDLSTATGKLQFHILAAFAEFEREIIRERTMDGLARARAQGKKLGRPFKSQRPRIEIRGME